MNKNEIKYCLRNNIRNSGELEFLRAESLELFSEALFPKPSEESLFVASLLHTDFSHMARG